jgi:hypothetical protein
MPTKNRTPEEIEQEDRLLLNVWLEGGLTGESSHYEGAAGIKAVEVLAREIVRLRAEVADLKAESGAPAVVGAPEIRTRRLVVVDEDGQERIVLGCGQQVAGSWLDTATFEMRNHVGTRTVAIRTGDKLTTMTLLAGRVLPGEISQACLEISCMDEPDSVGESNEPHVNVTTIDAYNNMDVIADTLAESAGPLSSRGHQRQINVLRACVSELMEETETETV